MTPGGWTRDELCALAAGRTVRVSGPTGHDAPVPYWLGCAAGHVSELSAAERISARYPVDQAQATAAFRSALARPGELVEVEYRTRAPGSEGWRRERSRLVNLVDRDDVRGVVVVVEDLGPAETPEGGADGSGGADGHDPSVDWLLYWLDEQGVVTSVEGMPERVLGITADELIGVSPIEFARPEGIGEIIKMWVTVTETPGSARTSRHRIVRPDGTEAWIEVTLVHHVREDGTSGYYGVCHDLDARREMEHARQDAELRLTQLSHEHRLMADSNDLALFRCDTDGAIITADERWVAMASALGAQPFGCLTDMADDEGSSHLTDALRSAVSMADLQPTDGSVTSVEVGARLGAMELAFDLRAVRNGDSVSVVGSAHDVTDVVRRRRRKRRDTVTGLLNRATLEARLADALAHDRSGTLVVYLDLDRFGQVNETYGYDAGDEVLEAVAERLRQAVRPGDEVCRYGGDEFVILCHDAADGAAVAVHRRIEDLLATPVPCAGGSWRPAASIGIARPTMTEGLGEVIDRAGRTMADEKRKRRADLS